jgi:hypothetical protein
MELSKMVPVLMVLPCQVPCLRLSCSHSVGSDSGTLALVSVLVGQTVFCFWKNYREECEILHRKNT